MRTISGRARGPGAVAARVGLGGLACLYRIGVGLRNSYYQSSGQVGRVGLPVVSVGNITAGGTGKTPFVAGVFERLRAMGRQPVILIRGYRAARGQPADETLELAELTGSDRIVQHPDRLAGAEEAVARFAPDVLLLDDGFQHRRIHRDLDIVLVDATNPFGHGHLLPRGLLREPPSHLARADLIVLTRSDQVGPSQLASLRDQLARLAPGKPIVLARHRPAALLGMDGSVRDLGEAMPRRVVCFAGIANPSAFAASVAGLGVEVAARRFWPDHHAYRRQDVDELGRLCREHQAEALLTTCKDWVKLRALQVDCAAPIWALRVTIDLAGAGDTILADLLSGVLGDVGCRDPNSSGSARPGLPNRWPA